jgi:hypothetical protein
VTRLSLSISAGLAWKRGATLFVTLRAAFRCSRLYVTLRASYPDPMEDAQARKVSSCEVGCAATSVHAESIPILIFPPVAYYGDGKLIAVPIRTNPNVRDRLERILRGESIGRITDLAMPTCLSGSATCQSQDLQIEAFAERSLPHQGPRPKWKLFSTILIGQQKCRHLRVQRRPYTGRKQCYATLLPLFLTAGPCSSR